MTQEFERLDDEALDGVVAAGGKWVVNAQGIGTWHGNGSVTSNQGGVINHSSDSGTSSVRAEIHGNERHFIGYDTAKGGEYLRAVRPI